MDLTSVSDTDVVMHDGAAVHRYEGLEPAHDYTFDGVAVRTLDRPPGEHLCTFTTTNDVHFGEIVCGILEGFDMGPTFTAEPGDPPYPEVMNGGAIAEMQAIDPAVVVVKGDLTSNGTIEEYADFLRFYESAFGDRLVHVRGNHDSYHGGTYAAWPTQRVDLPGVTLAVLDTSIPHDYPGRVTDEQLDWLDTVGAEADRPVLVFGHHHPWSPHSNQRPDRYFGILPDDAERLVAVFARRPRLRGYFAGHTHKNRVRRFASTGDVPYVEVACVKDFPGAWAEYRVFEGGIVQVVRRISTPEALVWTEKTRQMFGGMYFDYSFGALEDRCFVLPAQPA